MGWLKKQEKRVFVVNLEQKIEALNLHVDKLRERLNDLEWLKIAFWRLEHTCEQKEHELIYREPTNYLSGYHIRIKELEKLGWHIKRVSDCGKYEIWMPK